MAPGTTQIPRDAPASKKSRSPAASSAIRGHWMGQSLQTTLSVPPASR